MEEFDPGALLAPVAAAAALGRSADLRAALARALDAGVEPVAVRETLLLLAPFGGFPRTLDALAVLRAEFAARGLAAAAVEDPDDRHVHTARGEERFALVYGAAAERVMARLLALDPELPHWVIRDAYGRVMSRPGLSAAQRERIAIVFLCALDLPNQLVGHVRGALLCGATPNEIEATLAAAESALPAAAVAAARAAAGP